MVGSLILVPETERSVSEVSKWRIGEVSPLVSE